MASWRSSISYVQNDCDSGEDDDEFDEFEDINRRRDSNNWRKEMYKKTRRRSSIQANNFVSSTTTYSQSYKNNKRMNNNNRRRSRKFSEDSDDIDYYKKSIYRDRNNASPPSWKQEKPKPKRRRSSIQQYSSTKSSSSSRKKVVSHNRGSNGRRRPSYLIESKRMMDSAREVDEEEQIRKTLGRIPGILRDGNRSNGYYGNSRGRGRSYEDGYTGNLMERVKMKEKKKMRDKILSSKKDIKREVSDSMTDLMTVNDLEHFSTARFDTIITCCRYSRGFPNMANPTRIEVYDIFKSDKYSSEGAGEIAEALTENKAGLRRLEFRDCYFNDSDCAGLMKAIRDNKTICLKTLRFDGNTIGNEAAEQIAIWLENVTKLNTLSLARCNLTMTGIKLITKAIEINEANLTKTLDIIELDERDKISDDAIDMLLDAVDLVEAELKIVKSTMRRTYSRSKNKK